MRNSYLKARPSTNASVEMIAGEEAKKHRKSGATPLTPSERGQTIPSRDEERVPRLPHERDESADSQAGEENSPSAEHSRQAFEDVERGLVNTDQGLEAHSLVKEASSSGKRKNGKNPT